MALFELFRFLSETRKVTPLDPSAVRAAGAAGDKHADYHRQIVRSGGAFAVLGLAAGAVLIAALWNEKGGQVSVHDVKLLVAVPLMAVLAGFCLGVAVACLFAPTSFLTGPVGRKWMKFIGTRSVLGARVVCLLVGLILGVVPVAVGLIVLFAR